MALGSQPRVGQSTSALRKRHLSAATRPLFIDSLQYYSAGDGQQLPPGLYPTNFPASGQAEPLVVAYSPTVTNEMLGLK